MGGTWTPGNVEWGAYDHGMRVGVAVDVEDISHADAGCNFHATYFTQNNARVTSDAQVLNLSGAIDGQISYTNNEGTGIIQRGGMKAYTYNYGANEDGSSPGTKTFSATVGGSNAGSTASKSNSVNIPKRPYAAPAAPFLQSAQTNSDTSVTVQWYNNTTAGEPYSNVYVDRYVYPYGGYGGENWTRIANYGALSGASSMDAGAVPNWKFTFRIFAGNVEALGAAAQTNDVWTTPGAPANFARTTTGAGNSTQHLTWTNTVNYGEYQTQLWYQVDGGAWTYLGALGAGATSYDHTGTDPARKYRYLICSTNTSVTLSSGLVLSSESSGTTSAPATPTNLLPAVDVSVDPRVDQVLSWTYTSTDGSAQRTFDLQHRIVGAATWNTASLGTQDPTRASYTLPHDTYTYSDHIQWQVRVYGVSATPSAYASSTFFGMDEIPVKYPLVINLSTGRVEALSGGGAAGVGNADVLYYEQNYTVATSTVGYNHGLGTKGLEIEFYDSTGVQRFGDVTKTADTITMTFYHPMTGLMIVYGAVQAA